MTAKYSFPGLPKDRINQRLKEMDVDTHFIENPKKRTIARIGFHALRVSALVVEKVALFALSFYEAVKEASSSLFLKTKKIVLWILDMPMAVKRFFFPTKADRIEKNTAEFTQLLRNKQAEIRPFLEKLSHDEKKDLMNHWISTHLKGDRNDPEIKKLREALDEIADGDIDAVSVISENQSTQLKKLLVELNTRGPKKTYEQLKVLAPAAQAFIKAFENEREEEKKLTPAHVQKNYSLLLKHPNLLKREDMVGLIEKAPFLLKTKIKEKHKQVTQRVLCHLHTRETKLLTSSALAFEQLDETKTKGTYLSEKEETYLTSRIRTLTAQVGPLDPAAPNLSFEQRVLTAELVALRAQLGEAAKAETAIGQIDWTDLKTAQVEKAQKDLFEIAKARLNQSLTHLSAHLKNGADAKALQEKLSKTPISSMQQLIESIEQIQRLEQRLVSEGKSNVADFSETKKFILEEEVQLGHWTTMRDTLSPWGHLKLLKSVEARETERKNCLAKKLISMCLDKKAECRAPLCLAKKDPRATGEDTPSENDPQRKIREASERFVQTIEDKYLKIFITKTLSYTEFRTSVGDDLTESPTASLDYNQELLTGTLDTAEELTEWHKQLQRIWIEHIPETQEQEIVAISNGSEREAKIAESFYRWFTTLTGHKLSASLSFADISVQDTSHEKKAGVKTVSKLILNEFHRREAELKTKQKETPQDSDLHEPDDDVQLGLTRLLPKRDLTLEESSKTKETQGLPLDFIEATKRLTLEPEIAFDQSFSLIQGKSGKVEDIISILDAERKKIDPMLSAVAQKKAWVNTLCTMAELKDCTALRFMVFSEFKEIGRQAYANGELVEREIIDLFLARFKNQYNIFDFNSLRNFERMDFIDTFLLMTFAGSAAPVPMTEVDRSYLIQLLNLSSLSSATIEQIKQRIQIAAQSGPLPLSIRAVADGFQRTAIGFEGVEEHTLRATYASATNAPDSTETRTLLDMYRARSSEELDLHLLPQVETFAGDLKHDEKREALIRAVKKIHSHDPAEVEAWLNDKLNFIDQQRAANNPLYTGPDVEEETLRTSPLVFFQDLLIQLFPDKAMNNLALMARTEKLYTELSSSGKLNEVLLAYCRGISLVTGQIVVLKSGNQTVPSQLFYDLLKLKIAYQDLRLNYFDGKTEIKGFLKMAVDEADHCIIEHAALMEELIRDVDMLKEVSTLFRANVNSANHIDLPIQKMNQSHRGATGLEATAVPGFLSLGSRFKIDAMTGCVYDGGHQQMSLPIEVQNHPSVRALKIQDFPYKWDARAGAYVYCTKQNGESIPQIFVKQGQNGEVVIQKLLPDSFAGGEPIPMQYVARENVTLPLAAMHRMRIKHLWQNDSETLFGHDLEGNLVAIFGKTDKGEQFIQTDENTSYQILNGELALTPQALRVKKILERQFDVNELLWSEDQKEFFIPAIGLKLSLENGSSHQWVAECKGMSKKVLDETYMNSHEHLLGLVFKNEISEEKLKELRTAIQKAEYRLDLEKKSGLGHRDRHRVNTFEATVAKHKQALLDAEERVFLSTSPEELFFSPDSLKEIQDLFPSQIVTPPTFDSEQYFYREVHAMLETLTTWLTGEDGQFATEAERLQVLTAYLAIRSRYEKLCDRCPETLFFYENAPKSLTTKDLNAALNTVFYAVQTMDRNTQTIAPLSLIAELAKHPLTQPLTESQLACVEKTIARVAQLDDDLGEFIKTDFNRLHEGGSPEERLRQEVQDLHIYLNVLLYLHLIYQRGELTNGAISDKAQEITDIQVKIKAVTALCKELLKRFDENSPPSPELLNLWRQTGLLPENTALKEAKAEIHPLAPSKPIVTQQLQALASESLLERFSATHAVEATAKDLGKEISAEQKALIRAFQHSPEQVQGFHLEEMGHFNLEGLYSDFNIGKGQTHGLYGLQKEDVEKIFNFLEKKGHIRRAKSVTNYFHLASEIEATVRFNGDDLKALLTPLPLSEKQLTQITHRVRSFLFRATQSGFLFSLKKGEEAKIEQKLAQEKEVHLEKYLASEAILKEAMRRQKASWADLRYAFVSGDYQRFEDKDQEATDRLRGRLSNAMALYLFHKTEVQHIENVQKAPLVGERNKIELLQTQRNYSVDLLLSPVGNDEAKRQEQIMQRAFLAFEEDFGSRCNLMQIKMFRSLMLDTQDEEAIDAAQARMGFGKTALLPLMAIVRVAFERKRKVQERHLVRYIVPRAVIQDNTSSFNKIISSTLGTRAVQDREFNRYQIDPQAPELSLKLVVKDLKKRLHFYREMRKLGNVLIQWPEIRSSMEAQDLEFGQLLIDPSLTNAEKDLCLKAKILLGKIRGVPTYTVFDELDDTQDVKSREVNFTRGDKKPIPIDSIRPIERLISYIDQPRNRDKDWKDLKARAKELVQELCLDRNGARISTCPVEVIEYLTNPEQKINQQTLDLLSATLVASLSQPDPVHTENDSMFFLIRALLLDENILALVKNKQPNTHFGVRFVEKEGRRVFFGDSESESKLLISVPYEGTNTPKGLSIFDNTEVAAITTIRYYLSQETVFSVEPHLDFLVKQSERGKIPVALAYHYLPQGQNDGTSILHRLTEMAAMLDPEELRQRKTAFFNEFMQSPTPEFRKFFATTVVATQIRADEATTKSDRYEQGSPNNIEKGCSGTVGGTSSRFAKTFEDGAAEGKITIEIMGRTNNAQIKWLDPIAEGADYLPAILANLLNQTNQNTRAIVDAAGIVKSRDGTPETIVKELWEPLRTKISGIEGIIYYGKDGIKRLYRGPDIQPIPCTREMELSGLASKKYFSFYGQKNTRGSDIKQADGVHALVTIDENVSNSDAKQAILRFRSLVNRSSGQTFSFTAMESFDKTIKETLKAEIAKTVQKIDLEIARYKAASLPDLGQLEPLPTGKKWTEIDRQNSIKALQNQKETLKDQVQSVDRRTLQTIDIANFLRIQELGEEEKNALIIFNKEMKAHVKQAASHLEQDLLSKLNPLATGIEPLKANATDEEKEAHQAQLDGCLAQKTAYLAFLATRANISSFIERSLTNLFSKYGEEIVKFDRDEYVKQQTERAKIKIDDLFIAATNCLVACGNPGALKVTKPFYNEHIDRSADLFKKRYKATTPVYASNTNSLSQSQAQAQAQAQAEAQTESFAEAMAQSELAVEERQKSPGIPMSKDPQVKLNLNFIQDPAANAALPGIDTLKPELQNLIRPDLRHHFRISPELARDPRLFSHFVLVPTQQAPGDLFIFISQEEAALFEAERKQTNGADTLSGYGLLDARDPTHLVNLPLITLPPDPRVEQIRCVALGDNNVPDPNRFKATADLKDPTRVQLTNVTTDQLLPHMTVKSDNPQLQLNYFRMGAFGLSKEGPLPKITIDATDAKKVTIEIPDPRGGLSPLSIEIPRENNWLNNQFGRVFGPTAPASSQKITQIHTQAEKDFSALKAQLEKLKADKAKLEESKKTIQDIILSSRTLELTPRMRNGLDSLWADNLGQHIIKLFEATSLLHQQLQKTPSLELFKQLGEKFKEFVSEKTLQKMRAGDFRYTQDALFERDEVKNLRQKLREILATPCVPFNFQTAPLLEMAYIASVHGFHGGNVVEATKCEAEVCNELFTQQIPNSIRDIGDLFDNIIKVTTLTDLIKKKEQEIEQLEAQFGEGMEALQTIEKLKEIEQKYEKEFESKGLHLSPNTFFDQFQFDKLGQKLSPFQQALPLEWNDVTNIELTGALPNYQVPVTRDMAGTYQRTMKGFTKAEEEVYKKNRAMLTRVLELAKDIEDRKAETAVFII